MLTVSSKLAIQNDNSKITITLFLPHTPIFGRILEFGNNDHKPFHMNPNSHIILQGIHESQPRYYASTGTLIDIIELSRFILSTLAKVLVMELSTRFTS